MTTIVPLNWYAVVLAVAALASFLLTFPARHLATEVGYVAQPDDRKVHHGVTPQAGGVAMFLALLVAWSVAASIPALDPLFRNSSEPLGLVLGAAAIFVVGVIDDLRDMSAPAKMAGQVLAATVLYFLGVTWFQFKLPLAGSVQLSSQWLPLFTALWVIAISNAVNLIDGLDGLAAGVVAIASGALAVYGFHLQHLGNLPANDIGPLIAVVTCGICLGFLPHNFHPAKIFMGDAGALLLGLLMAASTMLIGGRAYGPVGGVAAHSGQTYFFFAPLFIPFFILGVPIVDMAFAFLRRTANRTGFSTPDKNHLHHRLLRLGHGHRRSVLILWAWTVLLSGFILFPLYISRVNAFIPFGALALGIILYTLFHPSLRKESGLGPEGELPLVEAPTPAGPERVGSRT
ncbi:MAG: undecaprenyl/decaprenyl-phosphate alpha-N-acetylglucosaminyl 1-phosphate transferase [Acidimicrobiales bacterium]|nr:undecaprenyl/decaprenyl-phosphate alpha-N-acetylglucosaminyl 1-phosphate transferase [Acidimicrobiales bacterium]